MNIVITGFMGSGKSTIGRLLAKKLGWKFYDCDDLIIQKTELSIDDMFRLYGEVKFRIVESDILSKLMKLDGVIIATGGGAITRYRNVEVIKRNGIVIYLFADITILYERIKKDRAKRPLLSKENYFNDMARLISMREDLYKKIADITIDTSDRLPQQSIKEITVKLKERRLV